MKLFTANTKAVHTIHRPDFGDDFKGVSAAPEAVVGATSDGESYVVADESGLFLVPVDACFECVGTGCRLCAQREGSDGGG